MGVGAILGRPCAAWRDDAAKRIRFGGVTLQIVRGWALRFNAEGPAGLISRKAPGKTSILNGEQRCALIDLAQWVHYELGFSITKQTLIREMRALWAIASYRPGHVIGGSAPRILPPLKTSLPVWRKSANAFHLARR